MKLILSFVTTQMDLEGILLSEVRQREIILCNTTYMWNVKNKISEYNIKEAHSDIEKELVITSGVVGEGQYRSQTGGVGGTHYGCKRGSRKYSVTQGI